jgi:hypothetical protein
MGMSVTDVFGNLFGEVVASAPVADIAAGTVVATTVVKPAPIPRPEAAELPVVDTKAADVDEVADFDNLLAPGPACAVCGSLESWTDLLGRQRCGVCERATLDKAIQWADRAARLRKQVQPRKPAPQNRVHCVPGGIDESKPIGDNKP